VRLGARGRICKGNRGREFGGMRFVGPSLDFSAIPLFSKFDSDDDKFLFYTSVLAENQLSGIIKPGKRPETPIERKGPRWACKLN
jgi:hypothetical protein